MIQLALLVQLLKMADLVCSEGLAYLVWTILYLMDTRRWYIFKFLKADFEGVVAECIKIVGSIRLPKNEKPFLVCLFPKPANKGFRLLDLKRFCRFISAPSLIVISETSMSAVNWIYFAVEWKCSVGISISFRNISAVNRMPNECRLHTSVGCWLDVLYFFILRNQLKIYTLFLASVPLFNLVTNFFPFQLAYAFWLCTSCVSTSTSRTTK